MDGLRIDGRRAEEVRAISCKLGIFAGADGSALYQQGNTQVIATVYGPQEVLRKSEAMHDRAVIQCHYSTATFASSERKQSSKTDRRSKEASFLIRQTFEEVILTDKFPRSEINIFVQILQSDGGDKAAAINAASLALINAGIPMKDFVSACSSGMVDGSPLVDLNSSERANGSEVIIAILPNSDEIVLLELEPKTDLPDLETVLDLSLKGCKQIHKLMSQTVKESSFRHHA